MQYSKRFFLSGFTLTELMVVVGLIILFISIGTVQLSNIQQKTYIGTTTSTVMSDIKLQQLKAMVGDTEGSGTISDYGIYFEQTKYTLFRGSIYSANNTSNYVINLETTLQFSDVLFPQSQIIFSKGTGSIRNFTNGSNTITLLNTVNNESRTISINELGSIISVN